MKRTALALTAVAVLAFTACGGDDSSDEDSGDTATTVADATATTTASTSAGGATATTTGGAETTAAAGAAVAIDLAETSLGEVLVSDGLTLYAFTPDTADSSACIEGCAAAWPPLVASGDVTVGDGLDASQLGSLTRDDGSEQVTYAGHPLYFYAEDTAPGDVLGQGSGDMWYVLDASGALVEGDGDGGSGY